MEQLKTLLQANEEWLMQRILYYAKLQGYAQYTSTLLEPWRLSVSGLTEVIVQAIDYLDGGVLEFSPDEDYTQHPVAGFGVIEARRHRERGVRLSMFLGLLKYYRQTYQDLLREKVDDPEQGARFGMFIIRCFDLLEIALSTEWTVIPREEMIDELQATNRYLTNQKNRYLTVFESIGDPVFLVDAEGAIVNLNLAAARLLKLKDTPGDSYYGLPKTASKNSDRDDHKYLSRTIVMGKPLGEVLPWLGDAVASAGEDEKALLWEFKTDHYGRTRHFLVALSSMLDVSAKYEGAVVVISDVTEQREAQLSLKISEERLSMALDATSDGMWDWNLVTGQAFFSPRYYTMLGFEPYAFEPSYEAWRNLVHSDDLSYTEKVIAEHLQKAQPFETEFRLRTQSGEWRWILGRGKVAEKDAEGKALRMVGTHMDITERRMAEEALARREAQFRGIFDNAGCGIALLYLNGSIKRANRKFRELLNIDHPVNLQELNLLDFLRSDFIGESSQLFERFSRQEEDAHRAERVLISRNGRTIWTDQSLSVISDGEGNPQSIALVCIDITTRVKTKEALQNVTDRLQLATKAGGIGVWEWDIIADTLVWDDRMLALYQVSRDEFTGAYGTWNRRIHPEDAGAVEAALKQAIETSGQFNREFRIIWPNDEVRHMNVSALTEYYADHRPVRMIGVSWDITERKHLEEQIRKMAATDPLTGVNNRRSFMEQAEVELNRCRRYQRPLTTLMIDIDHFKAINDQYGHHVGDAALQVFTQACGGVLRDNDMFGRIGGEEFAVILVETDEERALQVADRLRSAVSSATIAEDDISIKFQVSIGVAVLQASDRTIDDTLRRADKALYRAKANGRNQVASASA